MDAVTNAGNDCIAESLTAPVARLRVGVVGAGQQGTEHLLPALRAISGVVITAICDEDLPRARFAAEHHRAEHAFSSVDALIESREVDLLVVACPPQEHEKLVEKAITHGIPIFVEKPPAVSTRNLGALADLSLSAGVLTGVGMNFRHASGYRALKAVLEREDVGEIVSIDIEHVASKPRSALWGLSIIRSLALSA